LHFSVEAQGGNYTHDTSSPAHPDDKRSSALQRMHEDSVVPMNSITLETNQHNSSPSRM